MSKELKLTEKCKESFEAFLINHRLRCESMQQYPNLIFFKNKTIQIVCPDTINPRWLAVPVKDDRQQANFYVGYVRHSENKARLEGFAYPNEFEYHPANPASGWKNPTYRIPIGKLYKRDMLFNALNSLIGNYV